MFPAALLLATVSVDFDQPATSFLNSLAGSRAAEVYESILPLIEVSLSPLMSSGSDSV